MSFMDRRLYHVVAVAREGSFTLAAQRSGVTQSAVTKSIGDLERELGFLIFNRTARGAVLTDEGRTFVERAARLLNDAKELMRGRSGSQDAYAGVLRVGVCPASLDAQLVEPVTWLLKRYPSVRLDVSGGSFEQMIQQVRMGTVDIVLGLAAAFEDHPDLRSGNLPAIHSALYVRRGHPLLSQKRVTIADLTNYPCVAASDSRPYGSVIREWYESQGIDASQMIHSMDSYFISQKIIATTDAFGFATSQFMQSAAFERSFVRLPTHLAFPNVSLCWAIRARWEPRPAVRAFIQACREGMAAEEESVPI